MKVSYRKELRDEAVNEKLVLITIDVDARHMKSERVTLQKVVSIDSAKRIRKMLFDLAADKA